MKNTYNNIKELEQIKETIEYKITIANLLDEVEEIKQKRGESTIMGQMVLQIHKNVEAFFTALEFQYRPQVLVKERVLKDRNAKIYEVLQDGKVSIRKGLVPSFKGFTYKQYFPYISNM